MHEINPYNISGVPEKHLELGLHLAAPLQYAKKPIDNRAGEREPRDLWNMSLPSFGAQSNYLHHGHVARARKRRSVFTAAQRLSHRISPDYPGEKSSVTFPQITHSWSESNLHSLPLPPPQEGPDHDPNWGTSGWKGQTGFGEEKSVAPGPDS